MRISFRRPFFLALLVILCAVTTIHAEARRPVDASALPSWNDTPAKKALIAFVQKVTTPGSPDFVPQAERIAVFDNDGTLWPENPVPFQLAYVADTLKQMAARNPALRKAPMVQAALAGDVAKLLQGPHHEGLMHVIALTHAGMTTGKFKASVERWLATARHPRWHKLYDQLTYQPMQEVLSFLRANGFKTFIVSGGGADFMRVWSERVYGIPPQQVVGSTAPLGAKHQPTLLMNAGKLGGSPPCSNTPRSTIPGRALACSFTTPTPSASTPTMPSPRAAASS